MAGNHRRLACKSRRGLWSGRMSFGASRRAGSSRKATQGVWREAAESQPRRRATLRGAPRGYRRCAGLSAGARSIRHTRFAGGRQSSPRMVIRCWRGPMLAPWLGASRLRTSRKCRRPDGSVQGPSPCLRPCASFRGGRDRIARSAGHC